MRHVNIPVCEECHIDIEPNSSALCDDCYNQLYCKDCEDILEICACPKDNQS